MRQVGTIVGDEQVQRLGDYLLTLGIRTHFERDNGQFVVWALDEDRVGQARDELTRFVQNPNDDRYVAAQREAAKLRDEWIQKEKSRRKNIVDVRQQWSSPRIKPVTFSLIAASCLVFVATELGGDWGRDKVAPLLFISEPSTVDGERPGLARSWIDEPQQPPHRSGFQFWRLITPIFLHGGPLHLLMNMMAMYSLGTAIEIRRGSLRLAVMVLVIAVISNLAEYVWSGPFFLGMSGVAFGLFGYVWMKSEFDPGAGFAIDRRSVTMMLGWLVLCMTGWIGPIANACHFVGLVVGIVMGYGPIVTRRLPGR